MIHVLTAHFRTERWLEPQRTCLEAFVGRPYRVLCSVEGLQPPASVVNDDSKWTFVEQEGSHSSKLNDLATMAMREADPEDVLVFLDGDAIPIADLSVVLDRCRAGDLIAIRRDENLGDPIPHPSFCAVSVRRWLELAGDWSPGPTWVNRARQTVTDVGARLWADLEARALAWTPLLRTNAHHLHVVWFGVYGDLIYHHGAGFRFPLCRHDEAESEAVNTGHESQELWCRERGHESLWIGTQVYARIAANPVRTLTRCQDGSLFHGLAVQS